MPLTTFDYAGQNNSAQGNFTPASKSGCLLKFAGKATIEKLRIEFSAMSITITDALAYASQLVGTFAEGRIAIIGAVTSLAFTTTSAIASTLNSGVAVQYGFGSAAASATTLATTMINILPGSGQTVPTFTSSTTINVASATVTAAYVTNAQSQLDGTATAIPIYLNLAVATGTDIDGDATVTVTGFLEVTYCNVGDY